MQRWISLGAFLGGLGVIMGAFGAHSMKDRLSEQKLAVFHTATQYLVTHSLALILIGILAAQIGDDPRRKQLNRAATLFTAGIFLFSGSLYVLAFGGPRFFGPITPIGGLSFIVGWIVLSLAFLKKNNSD
ncbi:MAG: DUF423 domain-containing protein [Nitrospinales bacterium]